MIRVIISGARSASVLGLLGGALLLLTASAVHAEDPTLETLETRLQPVIEEQRFDGVVEAVSRSTVSAQTAGEIIELPFDVNDFVAKGTVILRIDDTRQKAELDKAVADEVRARARLKEAELTFGRAQRLVRDRAVSQSSLDKAEADLAAARAQVELSVAALGQAREQWQYTTVRAPYDGVLVERFVEAGEQVQIGARLVTGLSLENLRVRVEVPAHYAPRLRKDPQARVLLPDGGSVATSQFTFFPYADPASHAFTVRVQLPAGHYELYPGMLVKVVFRVGESSQLAIPARAIVHRSEVIGVYVVGDDQRLQFRQLRVGRELPGEQTLVLAGLEAGERIALDPVAAGIELKRQRSAPAHE